MMWESVEVARINHEVENVGIDFCHSSEKCLSSFAKHGLFPNLRLSNNAVKFVSGYTLNCAGQSIVGHLRVEVHNKEGIKTFRQ